MMPQLGETVTEGTITRWMKARRRRRRARRAALRGLDGQGRLRGALAGGRRPDRDPRPRGRDGRGRREAGGDRRRLRRSAAPGDYARGRNGRGSGRAPAEPVPPPPAAATTTTATGRHRRRHRHRRRRHRPCRERRRRRGPAPLSRWCAGCSAENGISETEVTGTGAGGRITRDDARRVVEARRAAAAAAPAPAAPPPTASTAPRRRRAARVQCADRSRRSPWRRSAPPATRWCPSRTCGAGRPSTWCGPRPRRRTPSSPTRSTSRASSACARPGVSASRRRRGSR